MKSNEGIPWPGFVVLGYLGLLVATVAALLAWPFSRPLAWLLCLLLGVFFLFSFGVLVLTVPVLVRTIWTRLSTGAGGSQNQPVKQRVRTTAADPGLWDRWLDGI